MLLTDRDYQIIVAVGRFGRLTTSHVRSLFFDANSSKNACYRRLSILVDRKFLSQTERPLIGGNKGGSGQYIYQLGSEGKKLFERGFYQRPRMRDIRHMLAIADVFVALRQLEAQGRYSVAGYETEPDSWRRVGTTELRPDLYVELADTELRRSLTWWLEVDLGGERSKQIRDKLADYYRAWTTTDAESFPLTVFLVPDDVRAKELRWIISHETEDTRHLFSVQLISDFPQALLVV